VEEGLNGGVIDAGENEFNQKRGGAAQKARQYPKRFPTIIRLIGETHKKKRTKEGKEQETLGFASIEI